VVRGNTVFALPDPPNLVQKQFVLIVIAVRKPILDLFWLARVKEEWRILERDEEK